MVAALDRPGGGQHGAAPGHAAGQRPNRLGVDLGDTRRPVGILGLAVGRARQIRHEPVEPDAAAREEVAIMQALDIERVGQPEHQRGIGVGARREPLGLEETRGVHRAPG